MSFSKILEDFEPLQKRKIASDQKVRDISSAFSSSDPFKGSKSKLTVFCAGSLGRGDAGKKSDLDSFIISKSKEPIEKLIQYRLFSSVESIHDKFELPLPSNDGEFLKVYELNELKEKTGEPKDDSENLFTVRMLLLLESKPLFNAELYERCRKDIIEHYFRDNDGVNEFKPIFIINDFLRYWRTLCLNYERIRNDTDKPWRKKNVNLKFGRMLTIFGTVLPITAMQISDIDALLKLCNKTPLERLANGLDSLGDPTLEGKFNGFLNDYEKYLVWKEDEEIEDKLQDIKSEIASTADRFSGFLYEALMHRNIDSTLKRMLVL